MELPFTIETELEARICADAAWKKGAVWGNPRPGHSEGIVMYHIAEVLANVECQVPVWRPLRKSDISCD